MQPLFCRPVSFALAFQGSPRRTDTASSYSPLWASSISEHGRIDIFMRQLAPFVNVICRLAPCLALKRRERICGKFLHFDNSSNLGHCWFFISPAHCYPPHLSLFHEIVVFSKTPQILVRVIAQTDMLDKQFKIAY